MNVIEVLDEIKKLSPTEKRQVERALLSDKEIGQDATIEERRAELHRQLLAEGFIKNIPTRSVVERDFEPVTIEGEPLSETIIEDRRTLLESDKDQPKDDEKRAELHRRLCAKGMLTRLPTREEKPPVLRDFKRLTVEGKPVSETIIEERR
ncbi:MAG: hypothetical protein ACRD6X_12525 [Pyrinomonadaceae bacterium]